MKCEQCQQDIPAGQEHDHLGKTLCEDCCMEALSPMRTCDPWAVHSAKSFEKHGGSAPDLTPGQSKILLILKEKGKMTPADLLGEMGGGLTMDDLQRDFSALRHMEKVRGEKQGRTVVWRLW